LAAQGTVLACPEMAVLELPFLFNDYGEVDHIRDTMLSDFEKYMEVQGFKFVAWIDQDFDQIYSTKYPISKLSDFARARFVTWFGPLEQVMLQRLGAAPIPVNVPEIAASVRQGIVDAQFSPAIWMVGTQMYSVVRFVNPIRMRYSPATIIVSVEAWDALPEDYKEGIWSNRIRTQRLFVADTRRDNEKCLEAMISYGVKEVRTSPEDEAEIRARAITIWDDMADELYPRVLLDKVMAQLAQYRKTQAEGKAAAK
ncbi:MAG: TRAP transporter substrate-binding protein DctP, partial [Pseudomonadota bacterium]